jgi:hypothetical protein
LTPERPTRPGRAGARSGVRLARAVALATLATPIALVVFAPLACDTENTCAVLCPTGTHFTNDGTCTCLPFDAGYCGLAAQCADAYCPASDVPDACGGGQLWSTTICGCYPLPADGLPSAKPSEPADAGRDGPTDAGARDATLHADR